MKKFRITGILLMTAVMLFAATALCACSGGEADYKVSCVDALGDPYTTGIVVKFMKNGEQVAMQACNENGVAEKTLEKGDYTVELSFTDEAVDYYCEGEYTLSAKNTEITAVLARKLSGEPTALFAGGEEYDAYSVERGCTYVELEAGKRNYFLFTPTEAGTYEFSVANDSAAAIGYYGAPHYVQDTSASEVVDNKVSVSISASMISTGDTGTSIYVIGIDSPDESVKDCVLTIDRTGDPAWSIEDEPWTVYETTAELVEYSLPEGAEIKEFDLTSADGYNVVFNEEDGYYHLDSADGPLVLVRLAENCDYIDCFATMLDRSGVSTYHFDDEGNFEKKVTYSDCLLEYIGYVDEIEGVYPMTEDLKYIIQQRGEYVGWWNPESPSFMFKDIDGNNLDDINLEIAWLMMCCYID